MIKDVNFEVVGKLLVLLREKSGKEQQEIAKALNVSKSAVSLWESGNGIQTEKIYDLARYYNITVSELISGQLSDENEEEYLQRNYDLNSHPSFEIIDEYNIKELMEYLSRCGNVIKRVFKLYPSYVSNKLNKKEEYEFKVLMSYFSMDYRYVRYMNYDGFAFSLRNLIEELTCTRGFEKPTELDYELSKIFELKIDVNPYQVIDYSQEVSDKYLTLLTQQQKDVLLTKFIDGKRIDEIENSIVVRRLLEGGAKCLYSGEAYLRPCENYDSDVLEGLEGKIIRDNKKEEIYMYFKVKECETYKDNERFFDPCSWKNLTKDGYDFLIDKKTTEEIKAIVYWRIDKPKLYMDFLEQKLNEFNTN